MRHPENYLRNPDRPDDLGLDGLSGVRYHNGRIRDEERWQVQVDILIVEDEWRLARLFALELEHGGFEVHTVGTGQDALTEVMRGGYDCMILDVMLPDLSGLEVCRRVRQMDDLPIIMVTARGQIPDKVAGLELGADDYMVKPINTEELSARIRVVTRRRQAIDHRGKNSYHVGNLSLQSEEHQVTVGGQPLALTALEFRMLEYFLTEINRVQSRDALMAAVWGMDFIGETNFVDVSVGRLRRRLESAHADVTIETIRGVGYVLRGSSA